MPPSARQPVDLYAARPVSPDCRPRPAATYVWLFYSLFFFIDPVLRQSAPYWFQQLPIYILFLALYIAYVEINRQPVRLAIVFAMLAMGIADIPFNQGASSFFIYFASLLPFTVRSSRLILLGFALDLAALGCDALFTVHNLRTNINYAVTAFFVVMVGISNLYVAQGKRADARLRAAQDENVALAAVAERERIARDLHDVLGHTLSVIVLKAELAGRLLDRDPARAATEIAEVERTARAALAEVREAIGGYRAKGLSAEVEQARQTLDAAGVHLLCPAAPPSLRAREETVLSLAVREAVTNIVRHAHATECTVHFALTPEGFARLEVADNGTAAAAPTGPSHEGNGLRGMRERVEELGGKFRIEPNGPGTRVHIEIPAGRTA